MLPMNSQQQFSICESDINWATIPSDFFDAIDKYMYCLTDESSQVQKTQLLDEYSQSTQADSLGRIVFDNCRLFRSKLNVGKPHKASMRLRRDQKQLYLSNLQFQDFQPILDFMPRSKYFKKNKKFILGSSFMRDDNLATWEQQPNSVCSEKNDQVQLIFNTQQQESSQIFDSNTDEIEGDNVKFESGGLFGNVVGEVPHIHKLDSEVMSVFKDLTDNVKQFRDQLFSSNMFSSWVKDTGENCVTFAKNVKGIVVSLPLIACVCAMILGSQNNVIKTASVGIIGLVLGAYLPTDVFSRIKDYWEPIQNYFSVQAIQQSSPADMIVMWVSRFISASVFSLFAGQNEHTGKYSLRQFVKDTPLIPRFSATLESVFSSIVPFLQDQLVRLAQYFNIRSVSLIKSNVDEIQAWINQVQVLVSHQKLEVNPRNADQVFSICQQGQQLIAKYSRDKEQMPALQYWQRAINQIKQPFYQANITDSGFRMRPITLMLRGAPQVGKSTLVQLLMKDILVRTLPEHDRLNFVQNHRTQSGCYVYNRCAETQYWDGYFQQFMCLFDDFGQQVDVEGSPDNEYFNWIRAINTFPNMCHMAELSQKGSVYFNSKIVLATSNVQDFNDNVVKSIRYVEALQERVDFPVLVFPKVEYCLPESLTSQRLEDRRLDKSKITKAIDLDIYEFRLMDSRNRVVRSVDYEQLVDEISLKYHESVAKHDRLQSEVDVKLNNSFLRVAEDDRYKVYYQSSGYEEENKVDYEQIAGEIQECAQVKVQNVDAYYEDVQACELTLEDCSFESQDSDFYDLDPGLNQIAVQHSGFSFVYLRKTFVKFFKDIGMNVQGNVEQIKERLIALCNKINQSVVFKKASLQGYKVDTNVQLTLSVFAEQVNTWFTARANDLRSVFDKWPLLKYIGYTLSIIGFIFCAQKVFNIFSNWFYGEKVDEQYKMKGKQQPRIKRVVQQSYDKAQDDMIEGVRKRNCYQLRVCPNEDYEPAMSERDKHLGFCVFVRGNALIMPKHFASRIKFQRDNNYIAEEDKLELVSVADSERVIPIEFDEIQNYQTCSGFKDRDIIMMQVKAAPTHRDITNYFIREDKLISNRDWNARIDIFSSPMTYPKHYCKDIVGSWRDKLVRSQNNDGQTVYLRNSFVYDINSADGWCGSLVSLRDSHITEGKIIGLHVAGSLVGGKGYCSSVCKESILECLKTYKGSEFKVAPVKFQCNNRGIIDPPIPGNFIHGYRSELFCCGVKESKLRRTPLYQAWGPSSMAPAKLKSFRTDDGVINPMNKALKHYSGPIVTVDQQRLDSVARDYLQLLLKQTSKKERNIFDFETAVQGLPAEQFCDGLDRSKSAGFPYSQMKGYRNGKKDFFGSVDDYKFTSEQCRELKSEVQNIIDCARQGERLEHIFTDFLKDETRKFSKVESGDTRLVSGCPLAYMIAFRQYFLSFSMAVMQTKIDNGMAVGINPYSQDWDSLAEKLHTKGEKVFAGDYSKFDSSQQPQILWAVFNIIDRWFGDDGNSQVRRVLWEDVTNSLHINGNIIYQWTHSLPSGHPITTICNSIYNQLAFRYVFSLLVEEVGMECAFDDHVYVITYGDDNVVNISDEICCVFNQRAVIQCMPKIGLVYTSENKEDKNPPEYRFLREVNFLKRGFRYSSEYSRWVAPLDMLTILQSPYYCYSSSVFDQVPHMVFETSLLELSLHGRIVFDSIFSRMRDGYRRVYNQEPEYDRWSDYFRKAQNMSSFY
ncbi:hypothetical protein 1 [Kummerowia striata dicistrovirus]|nr:hypothetical protein 1 [Kummerowia striata dicistrovirus]